MSADAAKFLNGFAQAISTMGLYADGHPARDRVIDASYGLLRRLQEKDPTPQFSFLGLDVIYGQVALRELKEWDWGLRLAEAGVQRLEFAADTGRDEYESFLAEVLIRLVPQAIDSSTRSPERRSTIKFGAIGVKGSEGVMRPEEMLPTATIQYSLGEEADTIRWLHDEVQISGELPLIEAESVVRSLSVAMHGDRDIVIPLLQLKEFDQYTTTHSLNVSVLAMALAEFIGLGPKDVRGFGVAGLLHDLGKVRIPLDVLTKPGKLTDEEWKIMRSHPVDGARIIYESDRQLDLASAVAYEHHIMINGGGYPARHFRRDCHKASRLVHICDVYDALRTRRPYREAWDSERVLANIQSGAGPDFDAELATAFIQMMRQWERRVAVVDDKEPLPHMTPGGASPANLPEVVLLPPEDPRASGFDARGDRAMTRRRSTPGGRPASVGFASLDDSESLRALVRNLREGIYITNERGEILDANPAFLEMLGVTQLADLFSYGLSDMIVDPARRMQELEILDRDGAVREFELQILRPDGAIRTVLDTTFTCRDPETGDVFYHGILVDISSRKEQEELLREQSVRDPLTGCYNRRYLADVDHRLAGPGATWACIFIDIDHFKQYNDQHGHQMGDHTLIRMSRFLMRQVRAEEAVVRIGGDEFLIVLEGATEAHTEMVARRLQKAALRTAPVPFSLGWATRKPGESFQQTMHRADQNLMAVRVIERTGKRGHLDEL